MSDRVPTIYQALELGGKDDIALDQAVKRVENKLVGYTPTDGDEKVKVSADDTTSSYLETKLISGTNTTVVVGSPGGAETIQVNVAADGAAGVATLRTLSTTATTACAGNDSRLSDSRAPSGAAGGDLGGTYPNPTVSAARGIRETSGPTTLAIGAIANGEFAKRVGTDWVGVPQGAAIANAVDEADAVIQLNTLLAYLRTAGYIAT